MPVVKLQGSNHLSFWCPACDQHHSINYGLPDSWTWNGNEEKPTFTPSVLCTGTRLDCSDAELDRLMAAGAKTFPKRETICHSFVTDGQIQYLGDCTHAMKNTTVPLPPRDTWRYE